jgi:hypothetical protein
MPQIKKGYMRLHGVGVTALKAGEAAEKALACMSQLLSAPHYFHPQLSEKRALACITRKSSLFVIIISLLSPRPHLLVHAII